MILGNEESKILKIATEYQSEITDGVVQYDYTTGKLFGAGFTTGTVENPDLPVIEIFRLPNTNRVIIHDVDTFCENGFDEEWEYSFKDSVEEKVREVLSEHLGDTISKLNEIRIAISDKVASYDYFNVRQDDWEIRVLDSYVDNAIEYGFNLDEKPADYLDAEVQNLASVRFSEDDVEFWGEVGCLIEDHDFDGALKMLQ